MAKRTVLYFATDLHGSERCFRKFLNAGPIYGADVMVLGGDIAGKAIQAVVSRGGGRYQSTFRGATHEVEVGSGLDELCQMIADYGYYPYLAERGELDAREADGSIKQLFLDLMATRLAGWMALAEERLKPKNLPVYWMLGNDDPAELASVLDAAPWGTHADGRVLTLDSGHELLSCGWSNETPWHSYRELPEERLRHELDGLAAGKIVFTSYRDGDAEIYLAANDGSNATRLTSSASLDEQPALSPDGSRIAFVSARSGTPRLSQ